MPCMTTAPSTLKVLHVAVLKVETLAAGRSKVTFRTSRTETNPPGIEVAHTEPLATTEGKAVSDLLRTRIFKFPKSLRHSTTIGISFEELPDGTSIRVISEAKPTPAVGYRQV